MAYTNPAGLTILQGDLQKTTVVIDTVTRSVSTLVTQFLLNPNVEVDWDNMDTGIQAFMTTYSGLLAGLRVLVSLADGKVAYDTGKGPANTFANYQAGTLGENHNTRISILTALLGTSGTGFETKYSDTTGQDQAYAAVRMGYASTNGLGVLRVSVNNA